MAQLSTAVYEDFTDQILEDIHAPRQRYPGRKGIYPTVVDFDDVFRRLEIRPILANELDLSTEPGREKFNRLVYSRYDGDVFSNIPACPCRHTKGTPFIGENCEECGYPVVPLTEQTIEPIIWVSAPDQIPGFMNLQIYRLLKARFTKSGFSVIDYLLDPKYTPPKSDSQEELIVNRLIERRGLTYFHDNFDDIMEGLCKSRHFLKAAKATTTLRFLKIHRDIVWCKHLPFPSKIGFIVENVNEQTFVDPKMAPALSALISIANAGNTTSGAKVVESRIARSMMKLIEYYSGYEGSKIFDKKGVYRKLVFGTSPHWVWRTVITPQFKPHKYNSLSWPWGTAVLTMKTHLSSYLLAEDYTPNEIASLIYDNVLRTHYKLEELFDRMIAESPGGRGIPTKFTRFPSLMHGSTQLYWIDEIKRDPTQLSTSLPLLTTVAFNADFDGDYMTGQLTLDNWTTQKYLRMESHTGLMDLKHPFRVSNHAAIPATVLSTVNARYEEGDALSVAMED